MTAGSLLPVGGIARGTYHYQLNAMKRPDKDSGLLELVREAFENSKRGYGYKRVHLEPESMGDRVSAKRVMRLTARHGLAPLFKSASGTAHTRASPPRRRRTWRTGISTPSVRTGCGSRTRPGSRFPRARPICRP